MLSLLKSQWREILQLGGGLRLTQSPPFEGQFAGPQRQFLTQWVWTAIPNKLLGDAEKVEEPIGSTQDHGSHQMHSVKGMTLTGEALLLSLL